MVQGIAANGDIMLSADASGTITLSDGSILTFENVEKIVVSGGSVGGKLNDTLIGEVGADILSGGIGNDTLEGDSAANEQAGFGGSDTLFGAVVVCANTKSTT